MNELLRRVDALEAQLEVERTARKKLENAVLYRIRQIRAMAIRQETSDATERWHVGQAYTLGSKLRVPGPPQSLRARKAVEKLRGRDISTIRVLKALEEVEGLTDGRSNGVPRTV